MNFLAMFQHLLPRSRAWNVTIDSYLRRFFLGLANSVGLFREYFDLVYLDLFPATTRQLDEWETQFGIPVSSLSDAERRERLEGRWQAQGGQSLAYIEGVLNTAGFPVFLHNFYESEVIPPVVRNPRAWIDEGVGVTYLVECGDTDVECGEVVVECGNYTQGSGLLLINKAGRQDSPPSTPLIPTDPDTWPFFMYVGDTMFGDAVNIPAERREEFESLLLQLRPTHLWIGLFINYV